MSNETYFRKVLIEQVDSVEEEKLLGDQLDRAILTSFNRDHDFQADFHIHFSILNNSGYFNELNNKYIAIKKTPQYKINLNNKKLVFLQTTN